DLELNVRVSASVELWRDVLAEPRIRPNPAGILTDRLGFYVFDRSRGRRHADGTKDQRQSQERAECPTCARRDDGHVRLPSVRERGRWFRGLVRRQHPPSRTLDGC